MWNYLEHSITSTWTTHVKGNPNVAAYCDILDNSVFPVLWQQFGEGPFLFQHDSAPVH